MLPPENDDDYSNSNTTEIMKTANVILPLFPSVPSTSSSSTELSVFDESDIFWETHIQHPSGVTIPIKPTLKELLVSSRLFVNMSCVPYFIPECC